MSATNDPRVHSLLAGLLNQAYLAGVTGSNADIAERADAAVRGLAALPGTAPREDPAAGGDLAALTAALDTLWPVLTEALDQDKTDAEELRTVMRAAAAYRRQLAAAPASEAATEGERTCSCGHGESFHVWPDADCIQCGCSSYHDPEVCPLCGPHPALRENVGADVLGPHDSATPRTGAEAAAWSQHLDDTAQYAGGFTDPERDGIRAAARMMRDPNVQAQVAKTVGGES